MEKEILDDDILTKKENKSILKIRPILIGAIILMLGIPFKIMHWPGAALLTICSSASLHAYSFNAYIRVEERNILNTILSILGFIWLFIILKGLLLNNGHPYNLERTLIYCITLIIYFIVYYVITNKKKHVKLN